MTTTPATTAAMAAASRRHVDEVLLQQRDEHQPSPPWWGPVASSGAPTMTTWSRTRTTSISTPYRALRPLAGQHLVRCASRPLASGEVDHPIDVAQHRVDVMGDHDDRRADRPTPLVENVGDLLLEDEFGGPAVSVR